MPVKHKSKIVVTINSPEIVVFLKALQGTGLYGRTIQDAAKRLICKAIEKELIEGLLAEAAEKKS